MEYHIEKISELLKKGAICMVGNINEDGLFFRPMPLAEVDPMGNLWFFTYMDSSQAEEVREDKRIEVIFSNPKDKVYITIAGLALVGNKNKEKMRELFHTSLLTWFPKGIEDPALALMKVRPSDIDLWTQGDSEVWVPQKLLSPIAGPLTKA